MWHEPDAIECHQCKHPIGWHPLAGSKHEWIGCLECNCLLTFQQANEKKQPTEGMMSTIQLKDHESLTLMSILDEHAGRIGQRTSIPKGKTILCVSQEIALCEKLTEKLTLDRHSGVEIGERVSAS